MLTFNPQTYARIPLALFSFPTPLPLDGGERNASVQGSLETLAESPELNAGVADRKMARCCLAGLWLAHNFLEQSHELSQAVDTSTGSYWHGILHRREGDYENAKYWFRAVGREHPIFAPLNREAKALAQTNAERERAAEFLASQAQWNPAAFIDACAAAVRGTAAYGNLIRRVAHFEWEALFDHSYRAAFANDR